MHTLLATAVITGEWDSLDFILLERVGLRRGFAFYPGLLELLSNVVYGVGQAAFLSDSSSTWTPSLNFTLFTTNVSSTNPLSRFH
ncbi:MAG: hypothetical protein ACRCXB_24705, partial [Aeromonadaceae bacterium]